MSNSILSHWSLWKFIISVFIRYEDILYQKPCERIVKIFVLLNIWSRHWCMRINTYKLMVRSKKGPFLLNILMLLIFFPRIFRTIGQVEVFFDMQIEWPSEKHNQIHKHKYVLLIFWSVSYYFHCLEGFSFFIPGISRLEGFLLFLCSWYNLNGYVYTM